MKSEDSYDGIVKLLPPLAGIFENLDEASCEEVYNKMKKEEKVKCSKSEMISSIENGVLLGLFDVSRKYKLNPEFSSRPTENGEPCKRCRNVENRKGSTMEEEDGPDLEEYVKKRRMLRNEKLRNKYLSLHTRKGKKSKRKVNEKPAAEKVFRKGSFCKCQYEARSPEQSFDRADSKIPIKKEKISNSKLLVKKKTFETEPPYYDIFT